jgi:hypothetical protein
MHWDLRGRTLDEVTDFVFAHPVPIDPDDETGWWWKDEFTFDPAEHVAHMTAILRNADVLRRRYSREQLEQGFWLLISGVEAGLEDLIWDTRVPWEARARLIEATVELYRDLFAADPLDSSAWMFWDALAYRYCVPILHPKTDPEDRRIQDAMFGALRQILEIESPACQRAALHGLGHLRHPDTESVVTAYLERHPELSEDDRQYALACITGDVQ